MMSMDCFDLDILKTVTLNYVGNTRPDEPLCGDIYIDNYGEYIWNGSEWLQFGRASDDGCCDKESSVYYDYNLRCTVCGAPLDIDSSKVNDDLCRCEYCGSLQQFRIRGG